VASSSSKAVEALLTDLRTDFALKDLGNLNYFLGIEVKKIQNGIIMTQQKYAADIIKRANMSCCKPVATPLSTSEKLSNEEGEKLGPQDHQFQEYCRSITVSYADKTRSVISSKQSMPIPSCSNYSTLDSSKKNLEVCQRNLGVWSDHL